jgi:predicted transposase/invertase (TIGR01784 family)
MRFLDVKTDYAFKKVFGSAESKPILISFLNALIGFPPGAEIADLEIVDPYQIPLLKGMKDTYVDVKATLADGRRIIVEMQVLNVQGFEQRILYNAAKAYSRQLLKGEDYSLLNPVIALTLTDFAMFEGAAVTSRFLLLEKERLIQYRGDIELIFIELPKFAKREAELETLKDKWLYFVKHAGSLDLVPKPLDEAPLREAFAIANTAALTPDELEQQERRHDFILLQRGAIAKAQEDGLAQGIAKGIAKGLAKGIAQGLAQGISEGLAQGRTEEQRAIAHRLLPMLDNAAVAAATGLPLEEVARLRAEQSR